MSIAEKRKQSALMIHFGIAMPEVSPNRRRRSLGQTPGTGLCQGESGSGASLGAAIAKSDRTFRRPCGGLVFRGDCCVLSESDPFVRDHSGFGDWRPVIFWIVGW